MAYPTQPAHGTSHRAGGTLLWLVVFGLLLTGGAGAGWPSPLILHSAPPGQGAPTPSIRAASTTCPNSNFYGVSTILSLQQTVDCAAYAGYTGNLEITFVSMAYQESNFCAGAIESGSGTCFVTSPGCGSSYPNAEGILQEGTGGQCPPSGGSFSVPNYNPAECPTWSGSSSDWGGIYFNPMCSFNWSLAYYHYNGYQFWGSYLTGAYCNWAPNGFTGTGSVTCTGSGQNQANLPWSTVCPGDVCQSDPLPSYSVKDLTTGASLSCGGSFAAGDSIQFTASVQGGKPSFSYAWAFGDGGTGSGAQVTHTYTTAATVNPTLSVTDSTGRTGSTGAGCNFTVNAAPQPTISSFTANPSVIPLGSSTNLSVVASGGTSPYSYAYTGLPKGCTTGNTKTLLCTPSATGNFSITVTVTDARSQSVSKSTSLVVKNPGGPGITSFTLSAPTISLGGTVWINVSATGGVLPYTYTYTGLPKGCSSANTSTLSCTPTASGQFPWINATVTDHTGASVSRGPLTLNVTATVPPPQVTYFAAMPSLVALGGTVYLNATVANGSLPLRFTYSNLPPGCTSQSTPSLACTSTTLGNFTVSLVVTDAAGRNATASASFQVVQTIPPPTISAFTASPASVPVGGTSTLSVSVTGGASPLHYVYAGLPTGCSSSNAPTLSCVPTSAGNFSIHVTVSDALGRSISATTPLAVTQSAGSPSITAFTISPTSVHVGTPVTLSVTAAGGVPPYSYLYSGLPPGCGTKSLATLSCTPIAAGSYTVTVELTDATSHTASKSATFVVVSGSSTPLVLDSFVASQNPVFEGASTDLVATISGGVAPFVYSYTGLPAGCTSSNTASLPCSPQANGSFPITVVVKDSSGQSVSGIVTLTVDRPAAGNNSPSGSGVLEGWILIGGIIAVAGLLTVAIIVRRRRIPPPTSEY